MWVSERNTSVNKVCVFTAEQQTKEKYGEMYHTDLRMSLNWEQAKVQVQETNKHK